MPTAAPIASRRTGAPRRGAAQLSAAQITA